MKNLSLIVIMLVSFVANAQSIVGKWKTIDDETGKEKSHVEIYEKDGKYFGKIIKIVDPAKQDAVCDKCEGDQKGVKIMGMIIINNLKKDENEFEDGTILDPNNGKVYDCKVWVDEHGDLQVRGYVGWFYRTQTWKKI